MLRGGSRILKVVVHPKQLTVLALDQSPDLTSQDCTQTQIQKLFMI